MVDGKYEPAGDGLPDGWLKECRPRKNRYGSRIKGDMFYMDPINGYEFRSLKDAHRYLESGDISQCVMLPKKRKIEDLHTAGDQSHHSIASEGKNIQSGSMECTPGEAESIARKGANVEQPKEKKHKSKAAKQITTPLRSSPRLAALKIREEANNVSKDGHISTQTDIINQSQPKQVQKPRRKASSLLAEKKDGAPTLSSSEKVEDNYPSVPNQIQGASVPFSSTDVGFQNAPAEAPLLLQQVGLGETTNDMPGSALTSLFRHVWSDPCLEFAFRTLTGDIPVIDDALAVANYFLPPHNLKKGATPNCSSSAYGGTRNHGQVDQVGLSMPRPSDKLYGRGWFPPQ